MIESPIEQLVSDLASAEGWVVRKLRWIGRRNGPDRFFAKNGRVVLIEFKRPGKEAKGGQAKEIDLLKKAGVEAYVCDNPLSALRHLGVAYAP